VTPETRGPSLDPDIAWYYAQGREIGRLSAGSRLEAERTRRIVAARLPAGALTIADVGGGPGAYALWLAGLGHAVHLVDPVPLHLEQARSEAGRMGVRLAGAHEAGAESLPLEDGSCDAALLPGPLYHLTERRHRVVALREAHRVLRPGGLLFAAAITRFASVVDGFFRGYVESDEFTGIMRRDIADGQHRNPGRRPGWFTTSFFHRPEELRAEMQDAGFDGTEVLAVEGAWPLLPDFDRRWKDDRFRSLLLESIEAMEADPSVIGFGGHLMGVARRPCGEP
jgi:ubiquinone/menaquinone biosynthesis C-methylase UbiE